VNIAGKLGKKALAIPPDVLVAVSEGKVVLTPRDMSKRARSLWGTTRALVATGIRGVSTGFTANLEINGVGYRANLEGKNLNLQLGFSHDIKFPFPRGSQSRSARSRPRSRSAGLTSRRSARLRP